MTIWNFQALTLYTLFPNRSIGRQPAARPIRVLLPLHHAALRFLHDSIDSQSRVFLFVLWPVKPPKSLRRVIRSLVGYPGRILNVSFDPRDAVVQKSGKALGRAKSKIFAFEIPFIKEFGYLSTINLHGPRLPWMGDDIKGIKDGDEQGSWSDRTITIVNIRSGHCGQVQSDINRR